MFVVFGGLGNMLGSVIAAALLTALPEALRSFADYRMLIYAIVLILVMLATNNDDFKALLRRARIVDEHKITIGDVELDYDTHTVRRGHDAQVLPPKEFNLLYKLLAYPERTFTRLELLDEIWGMDSESDDKTVNVHINRLRTRFYDWPEFEIQTIRGIGYRAIKKV